MHIDEVRTEALRYARQRKEATVAEAHDDDRPDIPPMLTGWRGDHPVATLMPTNGAREVILHAGRILAIGFGCDVVAVTTEGWRATDPKINPLTGKEWEHGEMEDVAINHDGLAKGWITEMLNIMVVNRAGDLSSGLISFTATKKVNALGIISWSLEWGEEILTDGDKFTVGGVIPEELIGYMSQPDMFTEVMASNAAVAQEVSETLSYEEQRAHADCAVVKFLPRAGFEGAAMLMADNAERQAVLNDSLRQTPWLYDVWSVQSGWESGEDDER